MYRIRKNINWKISATGWKASWIVISLISLLILIPIALTEISFSDLSDSQNLSTIAEDLPFIIFLFIWFCIWIWSFIKNMKINKVKKFKETWWWIIKKVKITSIENYKVSWNNNKSFNGYYAEAKEWDMIYCSDAYEKWHMWWTNIPLLQEIYRSYWFEYDQNETYKADVLREYDKRTAEKQYEAENGWLFKKIISRWSSFITQNQRETIEKWYEPQYREVDWKRITVWDYVDVYIDPEDEKIYWMDIDFLFEK